MQKANLTLKLNVFNSVPMFDVTPPEAILLRRIHEKPDNNDVIQDVVYAGESSASAAEEANRLRTIYAKGAFVKAFPGEAPKLPETFEEAGFEIAGVERKKKS